MVFSILLSHSDKVILLDLYMHIDDTYIHVYIGTCIHKYVDRYTDVFKELGLVSYCFIQYFFFFFIAALAAYEKFPG